MEAQNRRVTDPPGYWFKSCKFELWHCFATAEVFFWKRLFRKVETAPAVSKLNADLGDILRAEPEVTLVEEP